MSASLSNFLNELTKRDAELAATSKSNKNLTRSNSFHVLSRISDQLNTTNTTLTRIEGRLDSLSVRLSSFKLPHMTKEGGRFWDDFRNCFFCCIPKKPSSSICEDAFSKHVHVSSRSRSSASTYNTGSLFSTHV